jgi:hypothetical protein
MSETDTNLIKSFVNKYISSNYIDQVITQPTTLSSNIFVSENNILIVGDSIHLICHILN